ncbi:MAG: LPS export ABC transporter periplasmic protein LptC [Desulfobacterales bacterium]|nr:MAG: LPS export ABC transporter periplasmic protein LptC [Desulfobacterales bacterium]
MPYKKPKTIKLFLIIVMLIGLSVIVAIFIGYRHLADTPEMLMESLKDGANMSIGEIHQTATRDGKKEWSLDARSARYLENQNQVLLKELSVTFFRDNGQEVYLTADEGILDTGSNDIEVSGHVVLRNENYTLKTENLNYRHQQRFIFSEVPVKIFGNLGELAAESVAFDINTNRLEMKGNVEGTLSPNAAL